MRVGRVTPFAPRVANLRVRRAEDCPPYQFFRLFVNCIIPNIMALKINTNGNLKLRRIFNHEIHETHEKLKKYFAFSFTAFRNFDRPSGFSFLVSCILCISWLKLPIDSPRTTRKKSKHDAFVFELGIMAEVDEQSQLHTRGSKLILHLRTVFVI